jgi:septum site-determining protein MinD
MAKRSSNKKSKDVLDKGTLSDKTRVIGIVSGKGGVGKTTFSANLGIALNAFGLKTLVIDCNVTTPHLSYYIGAKNYSTTLNNVFSGDIDAIFAPLDKDGLMFIPASEKFTDLKNVDMTRLRNIIKKIADNGRFEFIILDSAPGLGREAMGALQACDEIIFVTTPTAPNIMDIARCDEVARWMGHKKFYMAFNMVRNKDYEMTPEKAEELFDMLVLGSIPFDTTIMDATAQGVPIMWYKPDAKACDNFMYIAANLAGINLEEDDKDEHDKYLEGVYKEGKEGLEGSDNEEEREKLEPLVDKGYENLKKRTNRGFHNRLKRTIDKSASRFVGRIKNALGR